MANQGFPNGSGSGVQTSSTARTSGRGTTNADTGYIHGSSIAHPGADCDALEGPGNQFEVPGQLAVTDPI